MDTNDPTRHAATHRVEVGAPPGMTDAIAARLWERGALGLWERPDGLVAWFTDPVDLDAPEDDPDVHRAVATARWSVEADRDWQAEWKATIAPVRAGRTVVVPTWLADDHARHPDDLTLVLDPGRAFGSGHHATTTLCLEVLDDLDLAGDLAGRTVADIGCGSGILAIAAAARGASVVGVDIDADAIEVTRENAARNGVEVDARLGSIEAVPERSEIVVANLVTDVVAALATDLVAAASDLVIASGITVERAAVAVDALRAAGLELTDRRERDGWIVVCGHRRTAAAT